MPLVKSCALLLAGLLGSTALAAPDAGNGNGNGKSTAARTNRLYVVRMADQPVVAYDGGIRGLAATRPPRGGKIDVRDPDVGRYAAYLDARHDAAVARAGGRKVYDYRYTFNGFAAELTEDQAAALRADPEVLSVDKDVLVDADTATTPAFLGLDAPGGLWAQVGGPGSAGEGIVIGVVDSGIWPEHPSFSDRTGTNGNATKDGKLAYRQLPGWNGKCVPGQAFTASLCNQKLIAAQHFNAAWGGDAGIAAALPWEFRSVRDYNGHGTHTASTAGGNARVAATGAAAGLGVVSGIAPRARIAAYKALWHQQASGTASGFTSDLVAAIDQAVADGVDVINYSVSGSRTNFRDPVEIAFLFAADAGVFVATSAGNNGPTTSTVAHPGPWVTTVAAGTHDRDGVGSVTLAGVTYAGASFATAVTAPVVNSTAAGLPGADPEAVRLCFSTAQNGGAAALDPAKVAGKIVVCDRGVSARIDKSLAVQEAGGVGMVLVNVGAPASLNADLHFVPTVHLQSDVRDAVRAHAAVPGATAAIAQSAIVRNVPAPLTASFSSRGPLLAGGGDLLKPDVIAPGQDVLAGVAPPNNFGRLFDVYSGTSMSSPHVAGLAALLKELHPTWSPMAIKSALMTTASDVLDPTTTATRIFRQGAGHVAPNRATDPGLVYDSSAVDWFGFLCGTQLPASFCTARGIPVLDPSDMNGASIAIGDLPGTQTVTRRVTNVGPGVATYTASVSGIAGVEAVVTPSTLTLAPGESAAFTVAFRRTAATLNAYTGGALTWTDGSHVVRSPIVVRPVALAAPAEVAGSYAVTFGYDGPFTATARGLVPATTFAGAVTTDPDGTFTPEVATHTAAFTVSIPPGTTLARFALFDADTTPGSDLDLFVTFGGALVGQSAGATSQEVITFVNPPGGDFVVYVHGFATAEPSAFTLSTWAVGAAAAGNMTVTAPATATTGGSGTITLDFAGLAPGVRYLGSVAYAGAAGMPAPTVVSVGP